MKRPEAVRRLHLRTGVIPLPSFGPTPVGFSHNIVADSISIVLSQKDHLGGTSLEIARSTLLTFYRLQ